MTTSLRRLPVVGILLCLTRPVGAADREFRLEPVRGDVQTVRLESASETELTLAGLPRAVPWTDVVALRREGKPSDWRQRTSIVWLSNGDRLIGEPLSANEDTLTVRWLRFPPRDVLPIPLERVTALCLKTPPSAATRRKLFRSLAAEPLKSDAAWLASGDRISGDFAGLSAENGKFQTDAGILPIRREQLTAVRFNPQLIAVERPATPRYLLTLSDGSRVTAARFRLTQDQLSFTTAYGVDAVLPADAMVSCQVFSEQVQPLSEVKPERVSHTPYQGGDWAWTRNRNVLYGPLELRGREFATGLGVHSQTAMTFALGPADREFRATVGIDDCAEGQGHVRFTILVDDRPVWQSPGLTGLSEPLAVPPVSLRGGTQLTLRVEFGEFGDVSDYADWCDAILLRAP